MNYAEYYDGKRYKEVDDSKMYSAVSQGSLPLVLDLSGKKEKEIPVYYENTEVTSFLEYFLIFVLQLLPFVGFGFLLYLAFQKGENTPKKTMAKAMLAAYAFAGLVALVTMLL